MLSLNFWNEYTVTEWKAIKISLAFFWVNIILSTSIDHSKIPYPVGIFSVINGSFLASRFTVPVCFAFAIVLAILYISEKRMALTTFLMFVLSLVLFTLEESGGILNRNGLYTMIFLAQAIAYYRNTPHLSEERIQFPIQIIAAGYMLAGVSKLKTSGLHWVTDGTQASLQIIKGYCYSYFDSGDITRLQAGEQHAGFILQHRFVFEGMLAVSLCLELFAWLSVKNKLTAFIYGLLLTAMHLGIMYFMHILIVAIYYPMVIFMVNPLYLLYAAFKKIRTRLWPPAQTISFN